MASELRALGSKKVCTSRVLIALSTLSPHLLGRSSARSDLDRGPLYDLGVNGRCHPDREISAIAMSIETDGRPHL